MNVLFTVCGRGGSTGVKGKNTKKFLGIELFEYTLQAISEYKLKNKLLFENIHTTISTDSEEFIQLIKDRVCADFYIVKREENLAQSSTPKMYAISDALKKTELKSNMKYEIIVDLDITSPIRKISDIENAVNKKVSDSAYDVIFSVTDARRNPYFNMVYLDGNYAKKVLESEYTARQQVPDMYDMNASIYAYDREFLTSGAKSPLDGKAGIIEMNDTGILDIDSENDFELMQVIADWIIKNNKAYAYLSDLMSKQ